MSVLNKPAGRHYPIDDGWLVAHAGNSQKYVDIHEIKNQESEYVQDLIALGRNVSVITESQKASFVLNGMRVGNVTGGTAIRFMMEEESFVDSNLFAGGIYHPDRLRRVYANGTTARNLAFVGYGQAYGNPKYDNLPFPG